MQVVVKRLHRPAFLHPYWVFEDGFEGAEAGWPTITLVLHYHEAVNDPTTFIHTHYDLYTGA